MLLCLLAATLPPVTVDVHPRRTLNTFVPAETLGAAIDGRESGDEARLFTPHNLAEMRSAGLRPLTYRLRTELGVEAWHWNPVGTWSDPQRRQGYWTSSDTPGAPIEVSYGYRLPRRGNTVDQANDDGYSRLDDGDAGTYWKSNPYLDRRYTGDPDDRNPQWIVIDLGRRRTVDAIRVRWANPYAIRYAVEYWAGKDAIMIDENPPGRWLPFRHGRVEGGRGGDDLRALGAPGGPVRFVRIRLFASSHTWEGGGIRPADPRDAMGFAIRELQLGHLRGGRIDDAIRHRRDNDQTPIYVSSTDPWHRAIDLDRRVEQPGFDAVFHSGLTDGLPMLTPVPVLYDTPENAAAEVRWLKRRGYPVRRIEMGEEPDGQYCAPEHYAALYLQAARRLHAIDPKLRLGGPCFQTTITDVAAWPDENRSRSWMRRFLDYLDEKNGRRHYQFFSFEWYPFDDTNRPTEPQLLRAPRILAGVLRRLQRDGLSNRIPWMITEYGYSAFAGEPEVDLPGAILNLDIVGAFLSLGGDAAYLYGYEPNDVIRERGNWGNLMILMADKEGQAKWRLPTYWAAYLMTHDWCTLAPKPHRLVEATVAGSDKLAAYAVVRPDGTKAVLLLNKDSRNPQKVRLAVDGHPLTSGRVVQYGRRQYRWTAAKASGHPAFSKPPVQGSFRGALTLPPYSITVVTTP